VIFAYHGYPWLIHRLTYRRTNHDNLHVRGYKEEGTITTPFDMAVLNELDRFHLVADVMDRVPALSGRAVHVKQGIRDKLIEHREYITTHGEDLPEIREWRWRQGPLSAVVASPARDEDWTVDATYFSVFAALGGWVTARPSTRSCRRLGCSRPPRCRGRLMRR
jgi:xylulose-5-phosphate/fructose-6-phosphate phosphoketolase